MIKLELHMHLILYSSESTIDEKIIEEELERIIEKAKANNKSLAITGLLFFHNKRFVQVLEGEKTHLERLMTRLAQDNRHKNIERIIDEPIEERYFSYWNMDCFNLDNKQQIDPSALRLFKEVYQLNFPLQSDRLIYFYKTMMTQSELEDIL